MGAVEIFVGQPFCLQVVKEGSFVKGKLVYGNIPAAGVPPQVVGIVGWDGIGLGP